MIYGFSSFHISNYQTESRDKQNAEFHGKQETREKAGHLTDGRWLKPVLYPSQTQDQALQPPLNWLWDGCDSGTRKHIEKPQPTG